MRSFQFHKNFALDRSRLSAFFRSVIEDSTVSKNTIAAAMGVNPYMVEGFRGWFRKTGLGTFDRNSYNISEFGQLVARYDPYLEQSGTLWGLHYHLVTSQDGERAEVWYCFFNEFITPNKNFSKNEVCEYLERTLAHTANSSGYVAKDCNELFKCYTHTDALGSLGLFVGSSKKGYVTRLGQPDINVTAYILFDSWRRLFPTFDTLRLSQLCEEPEMIGRIFVMDRTQVKHAVALLQSKGVLIFADTQHEPVSRRFNANPLSFLEQYYQSL